MYRSDWELVADVHDHIANLANECRTYPAIDHDDGGAARLVTQFRHRLGLGLIQIGHTLAGDSAFRGLPLPPARPATWGPGS